MRFLSRIPTPLLAGAVMAVIGAFAWAVSMPWLFPSLGPTIAIQSEFADQPVARPWNVVIGHALGAAAGIASVYLTGAIADPPANVAHMLATHRIVAAVAAIVASMWMQDLLDARHPPAQATTLLVCVGALDADLRGAGVLAAGIALVALLGEGVRRLKRSPR